MVGVGGPPVGVQERQLGTQQPDPLGTAVAPDPYLGIRGDVAQQPERLPVGGDVEPSAVGGQYPAPLPVPRGGLVGPRHLRVRRVGHHGARIGIDEQRCAVR